MRRALGLFFLSLSAFVQAQDVHFSQFNASPLNLNPALAGIFNGDYRFIGNHRNQWLAVPVPYRTFSLSADTKLPFKIGNDRIGLGVIVNNDKAGDSQLNTNQASLSLSYIKKLNPQSTQFLSFGLQAGVSGKSFNPSKLTFDNQYNGDTYDPGISSIENFSTNKISYFDASFGVNWLYKIRQRTSLNIGTSVFHVNRPKQSFFSDNTINLDSKFTQHVAYQLKLNTSMDLNAALLFSKQGKYMETVGGTSVKYYLQSTITLASAISFGVYYRYRDALILTSSMDYENFTFGLSYDTNFSGLVPASNHRGGFELSLIYIIQKFTPLKSGRTRCPVFL